jgi:(p)ppGpp synthase/HD superfamily hydrolase
MRNPLIRAISLAARWHADQTDKNGEQYLQHLLRVLDTVTAKLPLDTEAQCAAVLHDALEDGYALPDELLKLGMSVRTVGLVIALTRTTRQTYTAYIDEIRQHPDPAARVIKVADLRDNLDPARLDRLPRGQASALRTKYMAALVMLGEAP